MIKIYEENGMQVTEFPSGTIIKETLQKIEIPVEQAPKETLEQKVERVEKQNFELKQQIQQDNLILFDVLATIYEGLLAKGSV